MAIVHKPLDRELSITQRPLVGENILIIETAPDNEAVLLTETEHAMFRAVANNNLDELAAYLQAGENVNAVNEARSTLLHLAAEIGESQMIKMLLEKGACLEGCDGHSRTPLHIAVENQHLEAVKVLFQYGADMEAMDKGFKTPLIIAVQSGNLDMANLLLSQGAFPEPVPTKITPAIHLTSEGVNNISETILLDVGSTSDSSKNDNMTALHYAAFYGNTKMLSLLFRHGCSAENPSWVTTPIHIAARQGHHDVVSLLLENNTNINALDEDSRTPLQLAAQRGNINVVQQLLSLGADITAIDKWSQSAVRLAIDGGHVEIVSLLMDHGASLKANADGSNHPLHLAASCGWGDIVRLFISRATFTDIDIVNENSQTALHVAARHGRVGAIVAILEGGANVNAKDRNLQTPLHLASTHDHTKVVEVLLSHGADINSADVEKKTPLHLAANFRCDATISLLLERQANVHAVCHKNETALHIAANLGHEAAVVTLIRHKADISQVGEEECTVLHKAVLRNDTEMVALLLRCKADTEIRDSQGYTPLFIAAEKGYLEVIFLLLTYEASKEAKDYNTWTALQRSAGVGNIDVVTTLLEMKCDPNTKNDNGDTALHLAINSNQLNVVMTLIEYNADINVANNLGETPLHRAAILGNVDIMASLLTSGAMLGTMEATALILATVAIEAGNKKIVKFALEYYQHMDARNAIREVTFITALKRGRMDIVKMLLDQKVDIETKDKDGMTPLFLALEHPDLISLLIDRSANVYATIENNSISKKSQEQSYAPKITLLQHYISHGKIDSLQVLLNTTYDIETIYENGETALHHAVALKNIEAAELLLIRGIDVDVQNHIGENALHTAVKYDLLDLAQLLLKWDIDINARTSKTLRTPLQMAIKNENNEMADLLIRKGADVNLIDSAGKTALHLAVEKRNLSLAERLLDGGAITKAIYYARGSPMDIAIVERNNQMMSLLINKAGKFTLNYSYNEIRGLMPNLATTLSYAEERERRKKLSVQTETVSSIDVQTLKQQHQPVFSLADHIERFSTLYQKTLEVHICISSIISNEKLKYTHGFPSSRTLHPENLQIMNNANSYGSYHHSISRNLFEEGNGSKSKLIEMESAGGPTTDYFKGILGRSMSAWASRVITSLLASNDTTLYVNDKIFLLRYSKNISGRSPTWALQFNKMAGIIREPGTMVVQILPSDVAVGAPEWYNSDNYILRFINAVYVCRSVSNDIDSQEFSEVLGCPEQNLSTLLHATLIAGLSIISILGGSCGVEQLVQSILQVFEKGDKSTTLTPWLDWHAYQKVDKSMKISPSLDWQVLNRIKCECSSDFLHRPLSPVGAAKAVGITVWKNHDQENEERLPRVWDLLEDKFVYDHSVRDTVFITHRWDTHNGEIEHVNISSKAKDISQESKKLERIKRVLEKHSRYVWIDTICIDKTNLSELDRTIRSMYNWYADCKAVVLDSGTLLKTWRERGWCLQEGAAAGVLYGMYNDELVSIQDLASKQKMTLCQLDLSLYYRPGNAAEILTRMKRRKTTQIEDMAYALTGIFSIHMTLAYGERQKALQRLLYELASQKGDLSCLSFATTNTNIGKHLPTATDANFLVAKSLVASTSLMTSHFGLTIEVKLIEMNKAGSIIKCLSHWGALHMNRTKSAGLDDFIALANSGEIQNSQHIALAIVYDIRSIMLLQVYDSDRRINGLASETKRCHRLQCCQIEEYEFERLFEDIDADYERIWIGDGSRTVVSQKKYFRSRQFNSVRKNSRQMILFN